METTRGMTETSMSPKPTLFLRTSIRLLIATALLAILFQFVEWEQIATAFWKANVSFIVLAAGLLLFNLGLQILKWHYLLRSFEFTFPLSRVVRSLFFGITAGTLTPGQVGEFGARAFHLTSERPETIIGLTVVDKLQIFAVILIGGSISGAILLSPGPVWLALLLAFILFVLLLFLRPAFLAFLLHKTGLGRIQNKWVREFLSVVSSFRKGRVITLTAVLSVLFYCTIGLQLHCLLNAFAPVRLVDSFLGFGGMMLAKTLVPLAFADLGTREVSLVYLLSLRNVPEAAAFSAGILLFAINILAPALIGLLFIPKTFAIRTQS